MEAKDIRLTDARYLLRGGVRDLLDEHRRGELDAFLATGRDYIFAIFEAPDAAALAKSEGGV